MRPNVIVELVADSKWPNSMQYTPTYCSLGTGSSRIRVALRNVSARKNAITAKAATSQVQLANIVLKIYAPVGQMSTKPNQEKNGSGILKRLDLDGLQ